MNKQRKSARVPNPSLRATSGINRTANETRGFIITGTHSGAGKTTVAVGLMAALQKRGYTIQPFKVGPDYIDLSYHRVVCGRPSYNLDTWIMGAEGVRKTFAKATANTSAVSIIEGVMGLFDGKGGRDEAGSTAHIAKILRLPVILVVDARSMARSAGALVCGFERFDPKVRIAGVIFNRVGSERHFEMLKEAVEAKCRAKVLGYIPRDEGISLPERHLGLVMLGKSKVKSQKSKVEKIGDLIERFVDAESLLKIADCELLSLRRALAPKQSRCKIASPLARNDIAPNSELRTKIAVAYDDAFCFYYQENLDMLKEFGAELVFFSPLKDKKLPENIQGIYIGGGYPELYAKRLEANKSLRKSIKDLADKGLPIYAECGGLMYLGRGLKDLEGKTYKMTGVFPWTSKMLKKRKALGYREIIAGDACPFLGSGQRVRGHEYHYSEIKEPPQRVKRVYRIRAQRSPAVPYVPKVEGYLYKNTLASYVHLHFASNPKFAAGFVKLSRNPKSDLGF